MQKLANLVIDLNLYGLEMKNIQYTFPLSTLEEIDKKTYGYLDEEEYFQSIKDYLFRHILAEQQLYDINIMPIEIELGPEKIFILKDGRKIHPLFRTIKKKEETISMENILLNQLLNGKLRILFICDKTTLGLNQDYESLFSNVPFYLKAKIEADILTINDIQNTWNILVKEERIYAVIRFLLLGNLTFEEIQKRFIEDIPFSNKTKNSIHITENKIRSLRPNNSNNKEERIASYRFPYSDE